MQIPLTWLIPTSGCQGLGCWPCLQPHPAAGRWADASLGSSLSSPPPSDFLPTAWKANCHGIWLFQSQLNLERDFLAAEITCATQRNESHSWRAAMDQNQCSAAGAACKITLRSCSIPKACDWQGDPYKMTVSDPGEDNRSTGEALANSDDPIEQL